MIRVYNFTGQFEKKSVFCFSVLASRTLKQAQQQDRM